MTLTDGNARRMLASRWIGRRSAVNAAVFALTMSAVLVATPSSAPVVAQSPVVTNVTELYAAVAAANGMTGATVTIAPGIYQLTTPLVVRGRDTRIEGAAKPVAFDASTRTVDPGGATVIRGTEQGFIIDANGVTITGIAITGANGGRKSGGAIAVNRNRTGFVLSDSTIVANSAIEGAGVFVERNAAAKIERSTFVGNTTSGKGGGVRVAGSVDVVNSTFTDNAAQSGGAVSVAGSAAISYSTFVDNNSNNSKGGGVDRNGGTLAVTGSILTQALQSGSDGSDCSGTPDLVGINFVGNAQGCNPGPNTLTRATAGPLLLGPLADNGGPTQTIAQLDASPAIDAGPAVCNAVTSGQTAMNEPNGASITTDQRGLIRPSAAADETPTRCDLGAYEQASLSVEAALTVDTSRYVPEPYSLSPGTVEVGVVSVPTSQIAFELATRTPANADGTVNTAGLRSIGLRSIGLRSITLEDIGLRSIDATATGLRSIDVKASGLRSIGLRSIWLRSIGLRSIDLQSIGLRSIGLRSIPLSEIPLLEAGGWSEFLACPELDESGGCIPSPFAGVPLQSITLEDITDIVPQDFTLESIDLSNTGLRSIGLRS
ncbi:MAG TPA: choice-of-anchor Q domain-containing protein, partial [Ilumatobacteraceae bacterium]|nr:choice-of-anchor Q domain-containing protein [Ilumatobacteraceae bacterium]